MYRRKISPTITFRYSAAGMCPHKTQAASQISFSKPMLALLTMIDYLNKGELMRRNRERLETQPLPA
jgi:hypothetical protein